VPSKNWAFAIEKAHQRTYGGVKSLYERI